MKVKGESVLSAKCLDPRNRADLIESTTRFHDSQMVGPYWVLNPLHQTVRLLRQRITPLHHNTVTVKGMKEIPSYLV